MAKIAKIGGLAQKESAMPNITVTRTAFLNLLIEIFFAVLPLVVLSAVWSHHLRGCDEMFWSGPEMSMTSCILYGLTLARFLQGAIVASGKSSSHDTRHRREQAASYGVLLLVPLLGVIASIIIIDSSMLHPVPKRSIVNLVLAILCFLVLGGHGIKLTEGSNE